MSDNQSENSPPRQAVDKFTAINHRPLFVRYNGEGSGDWVQIIFEEKLLFENHSLDPFNLVQALNAAKGFTHVIYEDVTDDDM